MKTTFRFALACGVLLMGAALMPAPILGPTSLPAALNQPLRAAGEPFAVLPDGRGGTNVESVLYTEAMGFDKKRSLEAFKSSLYPVLRANCAGCHSTQNTSGSGAQAPLHSDVDATLAHEYALTRVNFREPANSRFVARMIIDRHNCFGGSCKVAGETVLKAVTAWRDAVADMIPEVPGGVKASEKITEQQVLEWIAADRAKTLAPALPGRTRTPPIPRRAAGEARIADHAANPRAARRAVRELSSQFLPARLRVGELRSDRAVADGRSGGSG